MPTRSSHSAPGHSIQTLCRRQKFTRKSEFLLSAPNGSLVTIMEVKGLMRMMEATQLNEFLALLAGRLHAVMSHAGHQIQFLFTRAPGQPQAALLGAASCAEQAKDHHLVDLSYLTKAHADQVASMTSLEYCHLIVTTDAAVYKAESHEAVSLGITIDTVHAHFVESFCSGLRDHVLLRTLAAAECLVDEEERPSDAHSATAPEHAQARQGMEAGTLKSASLVVSDQVDMTGVFDRVFASIDRTIPWQMSLTIRSEHQSTIEKVVGNSLVRRLSRLLGLSHGVTNTYLRNFDGREYICVPLVYADISFTTWAENSAQLLINQGLLAKAIEHNSGFLVSKQPERDADAYLKLISGCQVDRLGTYLPMELHNAIRLAPISRQATPWASGTLFFQTRDGKAFPCGFGDGMQRSESEIILSEDASKGHYYRQAESISLVAGARAGRLPMIASIGFGKRSHGLVELLNSQYSGNGSPPGRSISLALSAEQAINPFDTPLGMQRPASAMLDDLVTFVELVCMLSPAKVDLSGNIQLIRDAVIGVYDYFSENQYPVPYTSGVIAAVDPLLMSLTALDVVKTWQDIVSLLHALDMANLANAAQRYAVSMECEFSRGNFPEIDQALMSIPAITTRLSWWTVVHVLNELGRTDLAIQAQRHAVPTLADLTKFLKADPFIQNVYREGYSSTTGERIIDLVCAVIGTAIQQNPSLALPTCLDLGDVRVTEIDIPREAHDSQCSLGLKYFLARLAVLRALYPYSNAMLGELPEGFIQHHREQLDSECRTPRKLYLNDFDQVESIAPLARRILGDMRESRKIGLGLSLHTRTLNRSFAELATSVLIMGPVTDADTRSEVANQFGIKPAQLDSELGAGNAMATGCGDILLITTLRSIQNHQLRQPLRLVLPPEALWAFANRTVDAKLRDRLASRLGLMEAICVLSAAYPEGSVQAQWNEAMGSDGDDELLEAFVKQQVEQMIGQTRE